MKWPNPPPPKKKTTTTNKQTNKTKQKKTTKKNKKKKKKTRKQQQKQKQNMWFEFNTDTDTATAFPIEYMLFMGKKNNKSLTVKKTLLYWSPLNWYDPYFVIFSKQSRSCTSKYKHYNI